MIGRAGVEMPALNKGVNVPREGPEQANAMEQVFLGGRFPGIIGYGRIHFVRYFLAVTGWHGFP
jgi:hypothetical protein